MPRRHLLAWGAVACLGNAPALAAPTAPERSRIERLIRHVETQKGVAFIRNGREYTAQEAAQFLRGKLEANGKDVSTAREFIDRIATRSSTSGALYQIRLANGALVPVAAFLGDELKRIESKPD